MKIFITAIAFSLSSMAMAQQKISLLFDFDKSHLLPEAKHALDSLLQTSSFNTRSIQLSGHTDSIGSDLYNDMLSRKRVNAVHQYLLDHGFPKNNLSLQSMGERQPINENADEAQRHANRRVDIIIPAPVAENPVVPVDPNPGRSLTEKITDTATRAGSSIILQDLNFIGGRHILLPESRPILLELLDVLATNPNISIEIHGHICCAPGAEDGLDIDTNTLDLSVNRAKAVYDYLVKNGISAARLSYKGFGHSHPLVYPEDTEVKKTTNRRVEIKIVKK